MLGDDAAWLLDMLLACEKIERFIRGVDGAAFLGDELRQEAILRQLTVLGEAALGAARRGNALGRSSGESWTLFRSPPPWTERRAVGDGDVL